MGFARRRREIFEKRSLLNHFPQLFSLSRSSISLLKLLKNLTVIQTISRLRRATCPNGAFCLCYQASSITKSNASISVESMIFVFLLLGPLLLESTRGGRHRPDTAPFWYHVNTSKRSRWVGAPTVWGRRAPRHVSTGHAVPRAAKRHPPSSHFKLRIETRVLESNFREIKGAQHSLAQGWLYK